MKRLLLILSVIAVILPAAPTARAVDVSFDFFYNNMSGGTWIEVADYGYCWQPDLAVRSSKWRPYTDGYWVYSDVGWTWVSYEDFGWATYHYGRWVRLSDRGWVWVVGRDSELEWGPAWVSWRTGGDHIGWAALPPRRRGGIALRGGAITGRVDIEFDIGPAYYNFVDVRYIGEPVLRERIYEPTQNVTFISQTVNVTNITYQNNVVYNYGPDYEVVSRYSTRPVQRLTIERQTNVDPMTAGKSGALIKVEGQKLVVAAPPQVKPGPKAAPPVVKEKITQAKVDDGWSGVSDPKTKEEMKKKMETEDPKKVPPPSMSPAQAARAASPGVAGSPTASVSPAAGSSPVTGASPAVSTSPATSASPAVSASPATSASPFGKGKTGKPGEKIQPAATGTPSGSPGATSSPGMSPELGKGKHGEWAKPTISPAGLPTTTPATTPLGGKGKGKLERGTPGSTASPAETSAKTNLNSSKSNIYKSAATPTPGDASSKTNLNSSRSNIYKSGATASPGETSAEEPKGKAKQLEPTGTPPGGTGSPEGRTAGGAKHKGSGPVEPTNVPADAGAAAGGAQHKGPANAPAGAGAAASGERATAKAAQEEGAKKKEKKGEESPAPTPQ